MRRPVLAGLLAAAAAALIVLFIVMRSAVDQVSEHAAPAAVKNITVTLDDQSFTLKDGAAATNTVRIVGEPTAGDVTSGSQPDAALLIESDPGGSGTFYYAVLAVNHDGTYQATNAIALGDRIIPEGVDFIDGHFVYRFLERKPGEPMAAEPTVEQRVVITLDPASNRIRPGT